MARKVTSGVRVLTCVKTGRQFEYKGVGRPPKYHPDIAPQIRAEQRKASAQKKRRTPSKLAA